MILVVNNFRHNGKAFKKDERLDSVEDKEFLLGKGLIKIVEKVEKVVVEEVEVKQEEKVEDRKPKKASKKKVSKKA